MPGLRSVLRVRPAHAQFAPIGVHSVQIVRYLADLLDITCKTEFLGRKKISKSAVSSATAATGNSCYQCQGCGDDMHGIAAVLAYVMSTGSSTTGSAAYMRT